MRQQRASYVGLLAGQRGAHRQALVRRDVLHQPEQLGGERLLWQRVGTVTIDPGRHLDQVVVGQAGQRAGVGHVDLVHRAVAGDQGGEQRDRGLAVVRPAPLLQQGRLLDQRRVAVEVEQLLLDPLHRLGARLLGALLRDDHLVVQVEVPQVVRRERTELADQLGRELELLGALGRGDGRAARAAGPRRRPATRRIQVRWFRPTWSTSTRPGSTPSRPAVNRWRPIATLHSPIAR